MPKEWVFRAGCAPCTCDQEDNSTQHQEEDTMENDYAPLDPYGADLATLRAAAATPEQTFEDKWKAERLHEVIADSVEMRDDDGYVAELRLAEAEAEVGECAPPNPYAAGIKALQARDARAREAKENSLMATKIDNLVTKLQQLLSSLGSVADCKSDNERATHYASYTTTQQTCV